MNVGKFIKNHRNKLNMTQKELAKTLGVHHITVCRWETNFIKPSDQHWIVLQNLLGTRKDNLLIPAGSGRSLTIKKIEPLKRLNKKNECEDRNKEMAQNYKKGISLENLAKFYNIQEITARSILLSQKIKLPRKDIKKDRICAICQKIFHGRNNKTCSKSCLKKLYEQNKQTNYTH